MTTFAFKTCNRSGAGTFRFVSLYSHLSRFTHESVKKKNGNGKETGWLWHFLCSACSIFIYIQSMFLLFCVSTVGHSSTSVLAAPDSSATMNALRDDVKENVMSNSIGEMKEENIAMSVAATTNADSTHVTSTTHSHNRTEKNRTTSARIKK